MEQNGESRNRSTHKDKFFNKIAKIIQWRRDSLFKKWCQNKCTFVWVKMNLNLKPYLKLDLK